MSVKLTSIIFLSFMKKFKNMNDWLFSLAMPRNVTSYTLEGEGDLNLVYLAVKIDPPAVLKWPTASLPFSLNGLRKPNTSMGMLFYPIG